MRFPSITAPSWRVLEQREFQKLGRKEGIYQDSLFDKMIEEFRYFMTIVPLFSVEIVSR